MGKGMAAAVLITLVAGAAIGYFVLPMVFPIQAADSRQTYFFDELSAWVPNGTMREIDTLTIEVTTQLGDSLELFFTGYIQIYPAIAGIQIAEFRFAIDNVEVAEASWIRDRTEVATEHCFPITYRYIATSITAAIHNITIKAQVTGNIGIAYLKNLVLSVLIL